MAALTTVRAGSWSNTTGGVTPWTALTGSGTGGVPGAGDTVTINHAVTVDVNTTVGQQGPGPSTGGSATPGSSAVAGGGSLATATYRICYVNVDGSGKESGPSPEKTQAITSGQTLRITVPALPSGVTSRNIYLSTSGTKLTNKLYSTGHTGTTIDCTSASWTDGTTTEAAAAALPFAVRCNAALTIASGVTLTMRGDISFDDVALTVSSGGGILFDPPSGQSYRLWNQLKYGGNAGSMTFSGSSGSRCSLSSVSGATASMEPFYDSAAGFAVNNGAISLSYVDVTRMGSATQPAIRWGTFLSLTIVLDHCEFDTCGIIIGVNSLGAGAGWNIADTNFTNSQDTANNSLSANKLDVKFSASAPTTGTRSMVRSVFSGVQVQPAGATFEDCFFPEGIQDPGGGSVAAAAITRCFYWMGGGGSSAINGIPLLVPMTDCYVLGDSSVGTGNFHILLPRTTGTVSGVIWDTNAKYGDSSDLLYSATSCTITVLNNLILKNDVLSRDFGGTGQVVTAAGAGMFNPNGPTIFNIRHCSGWVINSLCGPEDETAAQIPEYKSNLVVQGYGGSASGWHVNYQTHQSNPAAGTANALTASGATHNGSYGLLAGQEGGGYNTRNDDGTPGSGTDIFNVDPQWVDPLRNLRTWAIDRGYTAETGTTDANIRAAYADGIAALKASGSFVSRLADLMDYVRDGFAPTNAVYQNAGHDGVTIGALEGVFQSMAAAPTSIPKNHAANITITLTGTGTAWDGTTVFTPSGVTGVTKVSQSVASATSATIVVTTDPSNTGTLTITESVTGSSTATVTVATATLTITPTSGLLGATPTLTLVGTNTVWSQETAATLLSISGGTGATLATPTITTNTDGTVVLTGGCGTGTLTITDTSTGATDTVAVAAATAYYASGPTSGVVNVAKTYTLYANGTTTATVTGATDGTGSFAGTVALNGTTPVTLSYTPTDFADSPHTLSFTEPGSLTDPSSIVLTVTEFANTNSGARMRRLLRP